MAVQHQAHAYKDGSTEALVDARGVLRAVGLQRGGRFLDAGSGSGYLALAAAEWVGEQGRVYAVDARPEAVAAVAGEARSRGLGNLAALQADMSLGIPLADGSVDVCVAGSVLHDLVEDGTAGRVLDELARVLRPGGVLGVVEFRRDGEPTPGPPVAIRLTPEQVERIVSPHGLRQRTGFTAGPQHYGVVFIKET